MFQLTMLRMKLLFVKRPMRPRQHQRMALITTVIQASVQTEAPKLQLHQLQRLVQVIGEAEGRAASMLML